MAGAKCPQEDDMRHLPNLNIAPDPINQLVHTVNELMDEVERLTKRIEELERRPFVTVENPWRPPPRRL